MKPKMPLNQTFIPIEPGRFVEPEEEYAALMGEEALARERELAHKANSCNCGQEGAKRDKHKPGCPQSDKRRLKPPSRVLPPGGIL